MHTSVSKRRAMRGGASRGHMHTHVHVNVCTNVPTYIHTSLETLGGAREGNRRAFTPTHTRISTNIHMHLQIELHKCMYVSSNIPNYKIFSSCVQAVLEKRWWLVCIKSISVWRATSALQPSILGSAGNTLQHSATHCNTLEHTATHAATHCNTLKHTACVETDCNTLQHTLCVEGHECSTPLDP